MDMLKNRDAPLGASEHCPYLRVRICQFLGNFEDSSEIKDSVKMRPVRSSTLKKGLTKPRSFVMNVKVP